MPTMSLSHKLKLLSHFIVEGKFREIKNMFWVYPLWWNRKTAAFLLNRFFPKLGIDLFPPFLEIEPTTVCNLKCVCCEHTYWKEPSKNMTFEQFKKIFDDFGKPKWIGLTGIGSSYLNKDYHKMLAYAKSKGTIIEVFDHFAHFKNDEQIRELIRIGPDFQFISTYGASKNSFEKICVGSDYKTIEQNIKTFVRLKKQMKRKFPILNFHYIITSKSKDELPEFLDFVHSLNTEVGEILVTPLLHSFKEAQKYAVELDSQYVEKIRTKAKRYKIPITINMCAKQDAEKLEKKPSINNCKEYIMPFIFVNGDVTPCCGQNEANAREWQKKMSLGNALEKPFKEIWHSPKYKIMRKLIRENRCPKECALCPAYEIK
ncbi:MAG: SPASM domain-containing protein [Candidatus Nanoarchaeia archaeon]|nr:SPASM domain-containing protein [Candidatus Nanoarchaeia archaeon]MDD5358139.1 SPASM domain-containing protein [Candidatus Nanoarchaeia archaeon]MDD5589326.1 SPASM domain-containing protein [Candidatus Nanoarchaeia archaeon]